MSSLKLLWNAFWKDESGLVLSAEAAIVGTVGVLTAIVGMNAVSSALDSELKETALAIRSLDQSYIYAGHRGCGAWTAGSYYIQPSVDVVASENTTDSVSDLKAIQNRIDADRKAFTQPVKQNKPTVDPNLEPTPLPKPNQIPVPDNKPVDPSPEAPKS
jgi:hypothetical protein